MSRRLTLDQSRHIWRKSHPAPTWWRGPHDDEEHLIRVLISSLQCSTTQDCSANYSWGIKYYKMPPHVGTNLTLHSSPHNCLCISSHYWDKYTNSSWQTHFPWHWIPEGIYHVHPQKKGSDGPKGHSFQLQFWITANLCSEKSFLHDYCSFFPIENASQSCAYLLWNVYLLAKLRILSHCYPQLLLARLKESDSVTRRKENGIVASRESNSQEKIKLSIKYPESSFIYKTL